MHGARALHGVRAPPALNEPAVTDTGKFFLFGYCELRWRSQVFLIMVVHVSSSKIRRQFPVRSLVGAGCGVDFIRRKFTLLNIAP